MMDPFTVWKEDEQLRDLRHRSAWVICAGFLILVSLFTACVSQRQPGLPSVSTGSAPSAESTSQPISKITLDAIPAVPSTRHPSRSPTLTSSFIGVPAGTPSPPAGSPASEVLSLTPEALLSTSTATPTEEIVRFAVIGDFGGGGVPEADVAALVLSWQPELILTTGDNNYPSGSADTIDFNIGQFYHTYVFPYSGRFGPGAQVNRFFPTLGNHDWNTDLAQPYLDYFTLPGNERYYDFVWGGVHFFALDSDPREPDGVTSTSKQAIWLKERLAASKTPWQIIYFHAPPYSSGLHGSAEWMRWPFATWDADAVLAGHDHTYERIHRDGIVYFVNGLGGGSRYPFSRVVGGSQVRYNLDYGAQLVEAHPAYLYFQFFNRLGEMIDEFTLHQP